MDFIQVYTAIDSKEAAQRIADAVVTRRLAACCWVSGPITSTYWWQGKLEQAEEWVCTMKTRKELYDELEKAIKEIHTYDTPEVLATPIVAGNESYLDWIANETQR
ncbi:divalent-cation tolerance protein CutA [Ktedonobacter sp. SOSP1-52]|uniref:divalent-cation tolerance protein CutA n=1 Tax=Ktedonobacter sp. SOSP1-52 TaxID=2778366 RepID=UPI00191573CB|nr:divalent-cation tolerance protein CutA [Ktedonobacter sp. SOSP1-52]GHO65907.1 divalent-cation tolerance protein CutA [Ktedonobacter sp. SOSP1-52]